ncbi:MAG: MgpA protein [Candidatus Moranbacteria bacterium GW2011_GWC2_37_8]|nr:MAG: MgpA protein [Candidatus Moranbacteria bacterium GW2011_GWC2_37_8]KKQ62321.1 MAG: MgpA protein [Parcubacteria group bacterium GW2011_GWC1_38_22]KKQ80838.1 MAG: MgpA protein [Candidatus Moranbacteria bacterium GW2011_GWD2_38_7]
MKDFSTEFNTLSYVIAKSKNILLFAHSGPDGDTAGSVLAFKDYLTSIGKQATIACVDPIPSFLETLTNQTFSLPQDLDFSIFDAAIGCDSVERGFQNVLPQLPEKTVTAIIDHHPDITTKADVVIIDAKRSSTCEVIYEYFVSQEIHISKNIATYLMIGILSDTGNFQHANTSSRVMEISSDLMKKGASVSKIIEATFANKKLSTLKLWGRAFEKAKINPLNGLITTVLTEADIEECNASTEDIGQVASILNTVPGTKFSLVLSQRDKGIIKGSLRSEEYKGVDVSQIAHQFGGGGHKLASGFEVKGKIIETESGWEIV